MDIITKNFPVIEPEEVKSPEVGHSLQNFKLNLIVYCQRKIEKAKKRQQEVEKEQSEVEFNNGSKWFGFDLGYQKGLQTAFGMIEDFIQGK